MGYDYQQFQLYVSSLGLCCATLEEAVSQGLVPQNKRKPDSSAKFSVHVSGPYILPRELDSLLSACKALNNKWTILVYSQGKRTGLVDIFRADSSVVPYTLVIRANVRSPCPRMHIVRNG